MDLMKKLEPLLAWLVYLLPHHLVFTMIMKNSCYTIIMEEKVKKTQKTPKGHEIPIPTQKEFERNLKKAAKPDKSHPRSPKK
jgi:hypothetical protein